MSGGSMTAEGDEDQQCQHCGRYFDSAGVISHEANCEWADADKRMQDLSCPHARIRAPDHDLGDLQESAEIRDDPADGDLEESVKVEGAGDPPTAGDGPGGESISSGEGMRTDGGPMAVPEFDDSGADLEESDDRAACEGCGAPADECGTPELLPDEVLANHPKLREWDRLCVECSTDEDGNWTNPVEVFDA